TERGRATTTSPAALDYFLAALKNYRLDRVEQAAASCEEALQRDPGDFWAQYLKALCNVRARRWGEAKVGLTACLARRPEFSWPLQLRGTAYLELKEIPAAEADFTQALASSGEPAFRAAVLRSRSVLRIRQNRLRDAELDLQEAIKLQPDSYEAY